ncbi:3-phenylpropionate dioxygenase [Rhodococcus sp. MEB064]|nr:3-phenylpropionate dioxygenase [Rhodococcus sp. MEB064]
MDTTAGMIDPRVYSDPDIYQRELEQVFGRSWLFLAHDSQLPKRGSFLQTYMGEDPVLVVRQKDGTVKAFLNQCRHRGMRICRSDEGTAKSFTCSYHGWSYDLEGNLINAPMEELAYGTHLEKSQWGAEKVARIVEYKGFHFGTWSDDAPSFEDYLGDFKYHFDSTVDRWDDGLEFVKGASRWVIDCNWKFAAEQFASDMYHAPVSHASALAALVEDPAMRSYPQVNGVQYSANGHGTGTIPNPNFGPDPFVGPEFSEWNTANSQQVYDRVGTQRAENVMVHSTLFPNFSWLATGAPIFMAPTMRVWHPRGPNQVEVWSWVFVPKGAPAGVKNRIRELSLRQFSPAGVFETDDGENWTEIQQVLKGWKARTTKFNAQMGLGTESNNKDGVPGLSSGLFSEAAARGFYHRWQDLMSGRSWAEITDREHTRRTSFDKKVESL